MWCRSSYFSAGIWPRQPKLSRSRLREALQVHSPFASAPPDRTSNNRSGLTAIGDLFRKSSLRFSALDSRSHNVTPSVFRRVASSGFTDKRCHNGKTPRRRANVAALTGSCLRRTDFRIRFDRLVQLPRYDSADRSTLFVGCPNRASWRSAGLHVPESRRDHRQFEAGQESFLGCPGRDCRAT